MYKIKLEQFEGPLDLLLHLIEERELDISKVSIAAVTEQFIAELETADRLSPEELSDFLVVAAKLLYIKSKILLPASQEEEEDLGADLERQLKMYKEYVDASRVLNRLFLSRRVLYARVVGQPLERVFVPPEGINMDEMYQMFMHIIAGIAPIVSMNERILSKTVNIREKIDEIRSILTAEPQTDFRRLLARVADRTELIVTFLAMLELVKQRSVVLVQQGLFSEIRITSTEAKEKENL